MAAIGGQYGFAGRLLRIERLVQEVAWVEVEADNPEDAVAEAVMTGELDFMAETEACPPYAYSVSDDATGFEYTLSDARADGGEVGQQARGTGLESLARGSLMAAWERKLLDGLTPNSASAAKSEGL